MSKKICTRHTSANRNPRNRCRVTLKDFRSLAFDVVVGQGLDLKAAHFAQAGAAPQSSEELHSHGCAHANSDTQTRAPSECSPSSAETPRASTAQARVLIADDTPSVRESLAKLLRSEGYEVEVAANGHEALEKFDPGRIDLVLLDLDMPVTHGWEALGKMLALNPDQAVIIITGKAEPCRWSDACRAGILVEKPIHVPLLLESIRGALAETAASRRERIAVQHQMTRHTRPLSDCLGPSCHPRGGFNE